VNETEGPMTPARDSASRLRAPASSAGEPFLEQSDRYRLLVESIRDVAIYMIDANGAVASWNPGAERFKGYVADEIIGKHFSLFYTHEDRVAGAPARALEAAVREGKFEGEGWRQRKDGSRFWAHVVIDPIFDADKQIIGYAKITRDLTERRIQDRALRQAQEQFRLLVQGVADYAIYMLDPEGRVSNWNAGAQRIKGYQPGQIIGEHFSKFYTNEERAAGLPARNLETARRVGKFEGEGWRMRSNGERFWAHVVIDAIYDDSGMFIGFAKITRDVTEQRQTQRALEGAREALFQSQKMEAIGQLTGGIAHDFNNLLMAVLGSLELAGKRLPDDPKLAALINNAVEAAKRGSGLTQRMLAFARRQELEIAPTDVGALILGMSDIVQRALGQDYLVQVKIEPDLPLACADANQLESALLNLAVNARDAMPAGGQIVVSAEASDAPPRELNLKPGRYVVISVEDRGEGMDDATLAKATEPFFTTKGVGKGTGLGLSMVQGHAQQSGGGFALHSRPGVGTLAEIWLPVSNQALAATVAASAPSAQNEARQLVVLAVDDDALVLMNTEAMLEDMGHRVLSASSGHAALEWMAREPQIDLVITDQAMPRMTGLQLAETIRAERPDMPIVIATGYAELPPGALKNIRRLGKPFTQYDLEQMLRDMRIKEDA
jgi:PAS domain S-box-containing protein